MTSKKLKVETWPIEKLIPYARNPRKNDHAVEQVAAAIREFGFRVPIVAKSDGLLVDGHLRLKAAQKLGLTEVPVVLADDMTEAQIKAFRISVNRMAELAEWDNELLALEFAELKELGFDTSLTGFDNDMLAEIMPPEKSEPLTDEDAVPEVEDAPVVKRGDTWILGNHRLRCGDSTSAEDVALLMNGEKADMVFTDPPYGVNYEGGHFHSGDVNVKRKREKLKHDDSASIYTKVIPIICQFVDGPCYTWYADSKATPLYEAIDEYGEFHAMIVWHKINATYAAMNAQYKQRHEPCAYWKPKGCTLRWCGPSDERTVWEEKRDAQNTFHPTQKPTCLAERAINNHLAKTVLDLFGGSGSTLIACEKTGRKCFMMELDEKYVQVIIRRWQEYTGQDAYHAETGETFNSLAAK